ncbi:MAG: AmmeMemoRadiSam system protein B [Spirochaetales bacterium]|nr:AmmeMemoRadiSam system protein B [Spirochaetales bacterium]
MSENKSRKIRLPSGWYPSNTSEAAGFIRNAAGKINETKRDRKSVIVPHAGWFYSGSLAVRTISTLSYNSDIVVVIGGHLPPGAPLYYSPEESIETPLGNLIVEQEFIRQLRSEFKMKEDLSSDNTVEVQMPIIKYFFPDCKVVLLRIGSGPESIELGAVLYRIISGINKSAVIIGSTDLTHYGRNFMFTPVGSGSASVDWVKGKNDKEIIEKMLTLDCAGLLGSAADNQSACSSGAAAAVMNFARLSGVSSGELVDYYTSYDISPSESFVGYAGITF